MMPAELQTRPLEVLTDGGSRQGLLVLWDGKLAAVLIKVGADETGSTEGWYLEAGFGPCGHLVTLPPEVFRQQQEAIAWIGERLERRPARAPQ